jgi:predicted nucleic acid-binding Zn ribbon protein
MDKIRGKSEYAKCIECGGKLKGRMGQKFCSESCKSSFHYKNNKEKVGSTYIRIDTVLKQNRRILKKYFVSGQSQIKKEVLLKEGFDFNYFTHSWKAKNGDIYFFCYDFGVCDLKEKNKYELIMWQDYMK